MIERKDLSEDQEKALQHMIKFVSSKDRQMLLAGYAGTGKCLDKNSIIWTDSGMVRLNSLSNESHLYNSEIPCNVNVLSFDESNKDIVVKQTSHIWKDSNTDGIEVVLDCGYRSQEERITMKNLKIGGLWANRLKAKGYTIESFLDEFSSDDYRMSREQLIDDLEFWIDEMLGYNDVVEPETVADDEVDY